MSNWFWWDFVKYLCKWGRGSEIYFMDMDKRCKSCSSNENTRALIVVLVITIILIIYVIILIKSKLSWKPNLSAVMLKILTDYLQISGLLSSIEVDWPLDMSNFFSLQDMLNSTDNLMVPLDCALKGFFEGKMNIFF